ncbi:MAG: flavin reductase family protein [Deltaproteobacteria bacterium]|nr:flavin reductase family protein [Deltaproteobacteria bacterium]
MKSLPVDQLNRQELYQILTSCIAPRPIALVSTISKKGIPNLAPFSFFNAFGFNPPIVVFSPTRRGKDGTKKDTLHNLEEVPQCVVHMVPHRIVEQVNLASKEWAPQVDEFVECSLTSIPSVCVKPPRVKESPVHMECRVNQIISLGDKPGSGNLAICEVLHFHIDETLYENGLHPDELDLVARNGGAFYTRACKEALFELSKPQ